MRIFQKLITSFVIVFIPLMIIFYLIVSFIHLDLNAFHWSIQTRGIYSIGLGLLSSIISVMTLETDLYKVFFKESEEEG